MTIELRPLRADELSAYVDTSLDQYIDERIAVGEPPDEARGVAVAQMAELFPGGQPASGQLLFRVLDERGRPVGVLWIGPRRPDLPTSLWVWDIEIDEEYRGRGLGRATMLAAEDEARRQGATELGLNVFGPNVRARALYESIGYAPTTINMRKEL